MSLIQDELPAGMIEVPFGEPTRAESFPLVRSDYLDTTDTYLLEFGSPHKPGVTAFLFTVSYRDAGDMTASATIIDAESAMQLGALNLFHALSLFHDRIQNECMRLIGEDLPFPEA